MNISNRGTGMIVPCIPPFTLTWLLLRVLYIGGSDLASSAGNEWTRKCRKCKISLAVLDLFKHHYWGTWINGNNIQSYFSGGRRQES